MSPDISERSFEDAIEAALLQYGPDAYAGDSDTSGVRFWGIFARQLSMPSSNSSRQPPAQSFVLVLWPPSRPSDRR